MSFAVAIDQPPARRPAGRPSKVAAFRGLAERLVAERPSIPTIEILNVAELSGFSGQKSALYAMVADVRSRAGVSRVEATQRQLREERARRAQEALERLASRERLDAAVAEQVKQKAKERMDARSRREAEREERSVDWTARQYHPTGQHEESLRLRVLARRWFDSREATHKATYFERGRWNCHLAPAFGHLEPREVDAPLIRAFVEDRLATGRLTRGSVGNLVRILSSFFSDLVDEGLADRNPVRSMPRKVKLLYRNQQDPRATPFLERMEDIGRLRSALSEPLRSLFSVAVLTGIRPGELVALEWGDFRSDLRLMHVQRRFLPVPKGSRRNEIDTPKSGKSRVVPVSPACAEVLRELRERTGTTGLVFKPAVSRYHRIQNGTLHESWREGLRRAGLPRLTFYQATRHTFASQWVMAGHSIEKLSKVLGHSSIKITEVYAHLKPETMSIPDVISFGEGSTA
jgi:integrase